LQRDIDAASRGISRGRENVVRQLGVEILEFRAESRPLLGRPMDDEPAGGSPACGPLMSRRRPQYRRPSGRWCRRRHS
jgi:hypothetical protein